SGAGVPPVCSRKARASRAGRPCHYAWLRPCRAGFIRGFPHRAMKLSEMKQVLAAGNIRLTKSLGQNFLHDGNQLRRIVAAAELVSSDRVLEIGPGLGPLTELLLARAAEVLAIEKDRRLIGVLQQRFARARHLTLRHDDALEFLPRESRDWSDWKVVS